MFPNDVGIVMELCNEDLKDFYKRLGKDPESKVGYVLILKHFVGLFSKNANAQFQFTEKSFKEVMRTNHI